MTTRVTWVAIGCFLSFGIAAAQPGQSDEDLYVSKTDGGVESSWSVQVPSGSSDYMNVRYDGYGGTTVIKGISIAVEDAGASQTFPKIGLYAANTLADPTGNTPDLTAPFAEISNPDVLGGNGECRYLDFMFDGPVLAGPLYHVVVCFPPGDAGKLKICVDEGADNQQGGDEPNSPDSSFSTTDGYTTPASGPDGTKEWAINLILDCCSQPNESVFRLYTDCNSLTGDYHQVTRKTGEHVGLAFWGKSCPGSITMWMIFVSFLGAPVAPIVPIPFIADCNDNCCWDRICVPVPTEVAGFEFEFVAVSACVGLQNSLEVSNPVNLSVLEN